MTPRLLLAGTRSGCGKTTAVCALLQAFADRGLKLMACKSGPDYIDPMFHSRVIGAKSGSLDLFFHTPETARFLLKKESTGCDLTVLEGAMGYYDGIALSSEASAWALSRATETPTVLIVDARGSGVSLCAEIEGFLRFRPESGIRGVILNRISPMFYPRLKRAVEEQCGVPVFGYLPEREDCRIASRHLGLVTAGELQELRALLGHLAEQAEETLELDRLLALARSAPEIAAKQIPLPDRVSGAPRIAVAQDQAFCFYYRENLELLEELGAELCFFSPLESPHLPDCDGLYLGGGYPELYAGELAENGALREEIRTAVQGGLPTIAECGGFLYLQRELETERGENFPMCGVFPGRGFPTGRLGRFGYLELTARRDGLLCRKGEKLRAHEFHYWDCDAPGADFAGRKPQSNRGWDCGYSTGTFYAGFPHFHFYTNPMLARRFVQAAARRQKERA